MKLKIGTLVLFALLILTVIALKHTGSPNSSSLDNTGTVREFTATK